MTGRSRNRLGCSIPLPSQTALRQCMGRATCGTAKPDVFPSITTGVPDPSLIEALRDALAAVSAWPTHDLFPR